MADSFTWLDGERIIRFGHGVTDEASGLLATHGFRGHVLLTTPRAELSQPGLRTGAEVVLHVPPGLVDELSAELLPEVGERPLVALGGGRVIDTTKAIAGASGARCAAIPTTLSGAELTPFHRLPKGVEGAAMTRPALVISDPVLMASQPVPALVASAINAAAHAMEALYTPLANPISELTALRGTELIGAGVAAEPPGRDDVAFGALLAGAASGQTGFAVHHATCQSLVRAAGTPHAETNAVMLPHFAQLMAGRAPDAIAAFGAALGAAGEGPEAAAERASELSARCGHTRLSTLGARAEHLPAVVAAVEQHPALWNTPDPPGAPELLDLLESAL